MDNMNIPIVTSTDDGYFPGVVALYKSYLKNSSNGFDFYVLAYGDEELESKLRKAGIENIIMNKYLDGVKKIPMSEKYDWYRNDIESSAMYSRLLLPDLFKDKKYSIYVDADALILKNLSGLLVDLGDKPVAGTTSWSTMAADVPDAGLNHLHGIMTSFLVFNHAEWHKQNIYKKCVDLMNTSKLHFKTVVQGVLQMVLLDNYYKYPALYQVQGSHANALSNLTKSYFLHFVGFNPWENIPEEILKKDKHRTPLINVWNQYYNIKIK